MDTGKVGINGICSDTRGRVISYPMRSHKYPLGGSVVQFFGVGRGLALSAAMQEEETLVETLFELSDE